MKLEGKVAIITGASRGIGQAVAFSLAAEGAAIAVNFCQSAEEADQVVRALENQGARAIAVQADVAHRDQVSRLLEVALRVFGRADILVNNAGVTLGADLFEITDEAWDRVLDVNLKGTFLCCQVIGGFMFRECSGRIVNIASTAGIRPLPRSHHYVASKAGVIGLTRSLALTLAPYVTVNGVAPGFVETEAHRALDSTRRQDLLARIPVGRLATAAEVADVVRFLVCEGGYITGQTIVTDGGLTLS